MANFVSANLQDVKTVVLGYSAKETANYICTGNSVRMIFRMTENIFEFNLNLINKLWFSSNALCKCFYQW
jgi:hypothetical protein